MADFKSVKLENILFLDIETVSQKPSIDDIPEIEKTLWAKKSLRIATENESPAETYQKAGIYSEFGKIICISVGYINNINGIKTLRIKSFYGDDEKELLSGFNSLVQKHFNTSEHFLCAHNGKEFDFPFIARRSLINCLKIPDCLDTRGLKPWEVKHFDTLELWRFGDYKNYTSLETLAYIFNIPTPKDDITGAQVGDVYWNLNDLPRIVTYCQKDVITIVQLFLKFKNEELISDEHITFT